MPDATIAGLLRDVEAACPCLRKHGTESCRKPGYCNCVLTIRPSSSNKLWHLCLWPGHAAARALAVGAQVVMQKRTMKTAANVLGPMPEWRDVVGAIRALHPEQAGGEK